MEKAKKSTESTEITGRFVVEFPLLTEKYQEDYLNKCFHYGHMIYNQSVTKSKKNYNKMVHTEKYREIKAELREIYESKREAGKEDSSEESDEKKKKRRKTPREKELYTELNRMYREYGFSDFGMQDLTRIQSKPWKKYIDSTVAQSLGQNLWTAWNRFLFMDGQKISYKRFDDFTSLAGKSNKTGIRILFDYESKHWQGKKTTLKWKNLEIPIGVNQDKYYEMMALEHEIAFSRIVRKKIRGKIRYYVQILFKGKAPIKIDKETGEVRSLGKGTVGVYIGINKLAAVSDTEVYYKPLSPILQELEDRKAELNRAMDRSRRAMNPDNYNEDGTIKKQGPRKVHWVKSNHYIKLQNELRELQRKQAQIRKLDHYKTINDILHMGDTFIIHIGNMKYLQKRRPLEQREDGTYKSREHFGKQIAYSAPSMLAEMLIKKVECQYGGTVLKANSKMKVYDYNHKTGEHDRSLGNPVEDALYNAFLLKCSNGAEVDNALCEKDYKKFKNMCKSLI